MDLDFLHGKEQVLEQNVVLHAPYLPCLLPLNRRQWFSSIYCVDFETKFLLVSRLIATKRPVLLVPMSSGICKKENEWLDNSEKSVKIHVNITIFTFSIYKFQKKNVFNSPNTYFFISNVDSSWNTCAREKTVLVFLFRLQCIIWLLPSVDRSMDSSSSSSSIDSLTSSSESCDEFKCWFGDEAVVAVFGELVIDGDCLSGDLSSRNLSKIIQLFQMVALLWLYFT